MDIEEPLDPPDEFFEEEKPRTPKPNFNRIFTSVLGCAFVIFSMLLISAAYISWNDCVPLLLGNLIFLGIVQLLAAAYAFFLTIRNYSQYEMTWHLTQTLNLTLNILVAVNALAALLVSIAFFVAISRDTNGKDDCDGAALLTGFITFLLIIIGLIGAIAYTFLRRYFPAVFV